MPLNMDLYFGQLGIQRYELFMMEALGLFCSIQHYSVRLLYVVCDRHGLYVYDWWVVSLRTITQRETQDALDDLQSNSRNNG